MFISLRETSPLQPGTVLVHIRVSRFKYKNTIRKLHVAHPCASSHREPREAQDNKKSSPFKTPRTTLRYDTEFPSMCGARSMRSAFLCPFSSTSGELPNMVTVVFHPRVVPKPRSSAVAIRRRSTLGTLARSKS